ncbi:hypothetical protein MD484_g846, partial [Candolleomyces efflorescens]
MRFLWKLALAANVAAVFAHPRHPVKREYDTHNYYVVEHDVSAGASIADVARKLGVEVVEQLGELRDFWVVRSPKQDLEARGDSYDPVLEAYSSLRDVVTGDGLSARSEEDFEFSKRVYHSIPHLELQTLEHREKRAPPPIKPPPKSAAVKQKYGIEDPYFPMQWHLANDDFPEHMMNVSGLWEEGLTGKGVLTGLIDDGLDYTSEDLAANFDAKNSYDFNDHHPLPTPHGDRDHHGTRCAGQIAAVKNKACGLGIAYESKVSGIRILGGRITTGDEAIALNYGYHDVSLYSCSWGPRDDGSKMQGPSYIIRKAVLNGINEGRGGKGSVFVFASGNGGHKGDQCNFDGYTNSIYSVTVGAVDYKGMHPSSGSGNHIVTTDVGKNKCSTRHGGTSAAAPNVVGVFALALQARPDLTWRDMQYLCVETGRRINPRDPDWEKIATGKWYSYKYGFGVLDGWAYVQAAKTWKLVKPQAWLETATVQLANGTMDEHKEYDGGLFIEEGGIRSTITITKEMMEANNLETLEHINVRVWIDHTRRGDVEVELRSPNGIRSVLAIARENDNAVTGFPGWVFMSVKHWGEDPVGNWTIIVSDQESDDAEGYFLGWNMILWGTTIDPFKAKKYSIDKHDDLLPPRNGTFTITPPRPTVPNDGNEERPDAHTTYVLHPKPTANLPHDSTPINGTHKDGWLSDLSGAKQNWLLGIVGVIILLNLFAAIYYCRRHFGLWGDDDSKAYNALPGGENVPLASMAGGDGPTTAGGRRLYDVVEEDEGEQTTALAGRATAGGVPRTASRPQHPGGRSTGGIGFHSGFLDDDDPLTGAASSMPTGRYRDDVDEQKDVANLKQKDKAEEATSTGSGSTEETSSEEDGVLWEDARAK